jgi:NADPH:quinone reductase-like Zn-dependent oxidoreductase
MKAIVQERFGPPDVLRLVDADPPEVGADDVLVRVHAAALNPYDWHIMRGDPLVARLMGEVGLRRPKARVAGVDAAGRVEAVGGNVRGLAPGDEVLGFCRGAFAEYARAQADKVVPKPARLTFEQAAAVPMAGTTALRGIRDVGAVRAGDRVLVNGAAGGVGTYAVQIAAALGAEVSAVCSTRNVELVRSIGAAHVIDYTTEDFTAGHAHYDVILDNVGNRPLHRLRRALTPAGTLVLNGGGSPGRVFGAVGAIVRAAAADRVVRQRLRPFIAKPTRADLLTLTGLIEDGTLTPVLDRTYPLADAAEALRLVEQGHVRGKVVLTVP